MAGSSSAGPKIKTVAQARFLKWNSVAHHTLKTSRLKTVQVHWGQRDAFKRAGKIVQSCQGPYRRAENLSLDKEGLRTSGRPALPSQPRRPRRGATL